MLYSGAILFRTGAGALFRCDFNSHRGRCFIPFLNRTGDAAWRRGKRSGEARSGSDAVGERGRRSVDAVGGRRGAVGERGRGTR